MTNYVKQADAAAAHDYAFRDTRFAHGEMRKVLRQLVREAVRTAREKWFIENTPLMGGTEGDANRIAKKLIP